MHLGPWRAPWHWLFYGALVAATASAVGQEDTAWRRIAMLVAGAALAVWYWRLVVGGRLERSRGRMAAGLLLAGALWIPLLIWHWAYQLLMLSAFGIVCSLTLRAAIPAIAGVSVIVVASQSVREGFDVVMVLFYAGVAVALGLLTATTRAIERQSEERRQLIAELEATRAELAESERQAGVLAERQRLAREIHDTVAQGLAGIVTLHEAARRELGAGAAGEHLEEATRTARRSLDEARRFIRALRPEALEGSSLSTALRRLATTFGSDSGVDTNVVVTGTPRELGPERDAALLRVAQEALANVRKHARAGRVTLTLSYLEETTLLDVRDDGVGFAPNGDRPGGFGLTGMRERVDGLDGALTIESAPGEGTAVVVSFPGPRTGHAP